MPRPRFSNRLVADTFVIAASQTVDVDVDLLDSFYPQMMIKTTYQATGTPTGISVALYPGFVVDNTQTVEYADNGNTVTDVINPSTAQSSPQTKRSAFAVNPETYPRFLRVRITNLDADNSVSVRIVGDW